MITPNHAARRGWLMVYWAELRLDGQLEPVVDASPIPLWYRRTLVTAGFLSALAGCLRIALSASKRAQTVTAWPWGRDSG